MTTGLFVGKFLTLHQGHINAINKSYAQCDKLYIVICHSEYDNKIYRLHKNHNNFNYNPISYNKRVKWIESLYKNFDNITILDHMEDDIPPYPYGWLQWSNSIKKLVNDNIDIYFTSNLEDKEDIKKYFDYGMKINIIDSKRIEYNISSTKIMKEGVFKHWKFIPNITKHHYNKKIALVGIESTGKSTLSKLLANKFNCKYISEYGRTFIQNKYKGDESALKTNDYYDIASYHNYIISTHNKNTTDKITIFDTESITTAFYAKLYHNLSDPRINKFIENQYFDLILYLEPDIKWIDDGMRLNPHNRTKNNQILKEMILKKYHIDNIHFINGSFIKRYNTSIDIINNIFPNI